jgi:hypothetical protein
MFAAGRARLALSSPLGISRRAAVLGLPGLLQAAQKHSVVCGAWVLQQAASIAELEHSGGTLAAALSTPRLRGFSLRVPWKSIDLDFSLLDAGLALARRYKLPISVRFMAGRHTPARVFEAGSPSYMRNGEKVPVPFLPDGSPNTFFEAEYKRLVERLAAWSRKNGSPLLHLAWYGQDWAELNHGQEVRAAAGYRYENWLRAHERLLDIAFATADAALSTELPFSGHGPLTDAAARFADYVFSELGGWNPLFYCQANGWSPRGEWGAPNEDTEAAFRKIWAVRICRGLQMIQPQDYDWTATFKRLYDTRATYCEIYAPSFEKEHRTQLAGEIAKFMTYCEKQEAA